ncbi:RNA 2'-phosphotransferase [Pantoea sp. EKM101V]|uniref:RNA 2'-phosphotransferase n=1 Tax=Pantoea sp. EKM101V TaxID=1683695 RepID=UPI00142D4ACD|nr:RNA 2'-phosphotransferase [Pantoea sp. EKM101V]KAF6666605.1 RNA 2'-phosphotransferase [Pantoea sp. EKM101V]
MSNKQLNEISKFLSYILRHEPHTIGLQLDAEGWADINSLITGAANEGHILDLALIQTIVNSSDKKRFTLSDDGQRIRAAQGHSAPNVNLQHREKEPPELLYHGTATRFIESIFQQGLIAGSRHHVHLSQETRTAIVVGQRYGKPVLLEIESQRMYQHGYKFFQAENGVWLTETVPINFISLKS